MRALESRCPSKHRAINDVGRQHGQGPSRRVPMRWRQDPQQGQPSFVACSPHYETICCAGPCIPRPWGSNRGVADTSGSSVSDVRKHSSNIG